MVVVYREEGVKDVFQGFGLENLFDIDFIN